jgi:hypothetical protein
MVALAPKPIKELLSRIQAQYAEMPGLHLSVDQARRLWSLDLTACRALLDALVAARFLTLNHDGRYSRVGN